MSEKVLYSEQQRFRQPLLWIVLIGGLVLFAVGIYRQQTERGPIDSDAVSLPWLLGGFVIFALLAWLFYSAKLHLEIMEKSIRFRFWPFFWKYKVYKLEEIEKAAAIRYRPIREFLGWGLRISIQGRGYAYTVSGFHALEIIRKNGKRTLIGSRQPEKINNILTQLKLNSHS